MKCHYDVLGVQRDAGDDDLKKSYRKLALRWHPDKNLDNLDEAKEQFQLIQQAFDVLSDPQERAWYDDHREAILRGGLGGDFKDNSYDVFPFFTSSCYKGFGDDNKGFYAVYREVFNKISVEETEMMGENSESDFEIPSFGSATSDYEEVVHSFYAFWQSFSTRKSYAWLDQYDTRQALNRREARLMEKENKKFRDQARKDRNEEVRTLVAFVRKRDKRVEQYRIKLAEKAKENAIKAENSRKRQLAERKKVMEEYKAPEYMQMDQMEGVLKDIENQLATEFGDSSANEVSNSEDEDIPSGLFCVACNKNFKTDKAFSNHENSKKHKENVIALKVAMAEDDIENEATSESLPESEDEQFEDEAEEMEIEEELTIDEFGADESLPKKNRKNKKKQCPKPVLLDSSDSEASVASLEEIGISKKQRKKMEAKSQLKTTKVIEPTIIREVHETDAPPPEGENADGAEEQKPDPPSKSRGKKAKAAKQQATGKQSVDTSASNVDPSHTCVKCSSTFKSRNKLFEHFKKTGHSVPLSNTNQSKGIEKNKRRK